MNLLHHVLVKLNHRKESGAPINRVVPEVAFTLLVADDPRLAARISRGGRRADQQGNIRLGHANKRLLNQLHIARAELDASRAVFSSRRPPGASASGCPCRKQRDDARH